MTFIPDNVPVEQLDSSVEYANDIPMDHKQAAITSRRHRWFDYRPIASPNANALAGLAPGQTCRISFDHKPDFIQVSISGRTDVNGRCYVFPGEAGGSGIGPCGGGAKITMPAPQGGIVTIVNVGTTPTFGMVTAIAGYTDPGIDITLGS